MKIKVVFFTAHAGSRVDRLRISIWNEQSTEEQGQENGQAGSEAEV